MCRCVKPLSDYLCGILSVILRCWTCNGTAFGRNTHIEQFVESLARFSPISGRENSDEFENDFGDVEEELQSASSRCEPVKLAGFEIVASH